MVSLEVVPRWLSILLGLSCTDAQTAWVLLDILHTGKAAGISSLTAAVHHTEIYRSLTGIEVWSDRKRSVLLRTHTHSLSTSFLAHSHHGMCVSTLAGSGDRFLACFLFLLSPQ